MKRINKRLIWRSEVMKPETVLFYLLHCVLLVYIYLKCGVALAFLHGCVFHVICHVCLSCILEKDTAKIVCISNVYNL